MIIKRLKLTNFRNYSACEQLWNEHINILYGLNAQGKSNLLEAICYLGLASSFRAAADTELIGWEEDYFYLEADIVSELSGRIHMSTAFNREKKRRWLIDHTPKTRLADTVGVFHTVVFAPEDINLIKGGPEMRRRYLNRQISQLDQEYCHRLIRYNHLVRQRNACLKSWEQHHDNEQLEIWNEQLLELGNSISLHRHRIIKDLAPLAAQMHENLSGGEQLQLRYVPSARASSGEYGENFDTLCARELYERGLKRVEQSEKLRGLSLCGPHRDEIIISVNNHSARDFCSQGQQRTAALSLKLAELELAARLRGEYPVLLLDDVFSELDKKRRRRILEQTVEKAQTFITSVDRVEDLPKAGLWQVKSGIISPL